VSSEATHRAALFETETTSIHLWPQPRTHFIHTKLGNPADIPDSVSLWPRTRFILSRQSSPNRSVNLGPFSSRPSIP
jgi:hypothetical protein